MEMSELRPIIKKAIVYYLADIGETVQSAAEREAAGLDLTAYLDGATKRTKPKDERGAKFQAAADEIVRVALYGKRVLPNDTGDS